MISSRSQSWRGVRSSAGSPAASCRSASSRAPVASRSINVPPWGVLRAFDIGTEDSTEVEHDGQGRQGGHGGQGRIRKTGDLWVLIHPCPPCHPCPSCPPSDST